MKAEFTEKMDNRQNEIKVVFLGDGDAGKSLLLERLMHDGAIPADYDGISTPGIAIRKKQYDLDGRRIQVNFWDFGGQEIMHSMHRVFMTSRALYVVVLNARDEVQEDRARYWLQDIRSFAADAPVILVLNKNDQNPNASIDIGALHRQYSNLKQYVRMSALKMSERTFNSEFTAMLLEEIQRTGFLDVRWPTSWHRLKQTLENMDSAYIQGDTYEKLCREAGVEEGRKELLRLFNDLGICFCLGDEGDYEPPDHIVLRPDWITNALYVIIFNKCEGTQNGLIPHKAIYELLKTAHRNPAILGTLSGAKYTAGDIQYVLGVMRKFNLSFTDGQDREFIPMLCQQESAVDLYDYEKDENILEFYMEFDYMPANLLHRLIVERHTELDMDNVWRWGARFQLPELGLSAVVVIDGDILRFFIRQTDSMHSSNTYLTMLKSNVDRIVEKMGLSEPSNRLVYKAEGKRDEFEYEMLLTMMETGKTDIRSIVFGRKIPISDIVREEHIQSWTEILFRICEKEERFLYRWNVVSLCPRGWRDAQFETAFDMTYYDSLGREYHFGVVKIGKKGMTEGRIRDSMPAEFTVLPKDFFSLGQDEEYYDQIKQMDKSHGNEIRHALLHALRDAAYDTNLLDSNLKEPVMEQSLLINIVAEDDEAHRKAVAKIKGQFNRMAEKGEDRLTEYHFTYTAPSPKDATIQPAILEFKVDPASNPPTNVHAMIGRNGCGKTYLIRNMVQCLQERNGPYGKFTYQKAQGEAREFANVVCIAFSPFDAFPEVDKKKRDLPAEFVGLNEKMLFPDADSIENTGKESRKNILIEAICNQFWKHLRNCMITPQRRQLWSDAVETLKNAFDEVEQLIFDEITGLMKDIGDQYDEAKCQQGKERIMSLFKPLSSGHKVVLLTVTSCVAEIEERSILFLDEPENHLHPPLLSALIRTLSDLLRKRNGVAIVSTHSPVVLQELPKSCVWLLTRYGHEDIKPERLKRETFGSSLGTLIDEAFAFEVMNTGFHRLMEEASQQYEDFDAALEAYHGRLGNEASILLRMLMYEKHWEE